MKTDEQKRKHAEEMRLWRANNREKARAISRAGSARYSAAHPERRRESLRLSAVAHRVPRGQMDESTAEAERAAARRRYRERAERDPSYLPRKKGHGRKWRLENPELARQVSMEATRKWRAANPEKVRAQLERGRAAKKKQQEAKRREIRMALLAFFGGVCVRCGFSDGRALHLDHINGDGAIDRKLGVGHKSAQLKFVQKDPEAARAKYQLLCANCNAIKQYENGEYRTVERQE